MEIDGNQPATRKLLLIGLKGLFFYVLLSTITLTATEFYGNSVLPFYRWEMQKLAPLYQVHSAQIMGTGTDSLYFISIRDLHWYYRNGKLVEGGRMGYECHVLVLKGLQHLVLLLLLPLCWPNLTWRSRILALAICMPILLVIEVIDMPLEMLGILDGLVAQANALPASLYLEWSDILSSGGRLAISTLGGALACVVAGHIGGRRFRKPAQSAPINDRPPPATPHQTPADGERAATTPSVTDAYGGNAERWIPLTAYKLTVLFH